MSSIEISKPFASRPNHVGGIDVWHDVFNASEKNIKYITFTYVPYNKVGDVVSCSVKKESEISCQVTGPLYPGNKGHVKWEALWYNPTIDKVKIKEAKIQYEDDSEEILAGESILDEDNPESALFKKKAAEKEEWKKKEEARLREVEEEERKNAIKKKIIFGAIAVVAVLLVILMMRG